MRRSFTTSLRFYLYKGYSLKWQSLSFKSSTRQLYSTSSILLHNDQDTKFVRQRIKDLGGEPVIPNFYPRWRCAQTSDQIPFTSREFAVKFAEVVKGLEKGEALHDRLVTVYGRVSSRRNQGSKLSFIDVESGGDSLQAVLKVSSIAKFKDGALSWDLREDRRHIQRGDWIAMTGHPYLSETGQVSILVTQKPQFLAPSLQHLSPATTDPKFLNHNRHVDRIIHKSARDTLFLRHTIIQTLRQFFISRDFVEVSTPLLTSRAGGANARPFETIATEISGLKLQMRIAPELFLKRLIIGNMQKIFELGPAFRNEGVDATHNPEFYICEFYQAMVDLENLIQTTEQLFENLRTATDSARPILESVPDPAELGLQVPFKRLPFIPSVEAAIRSRIPDWVFPALDDTNTALPILRRALATFDPAYDASASTESIPTVLDALSSEVLEPQCTRPTWITHHPECMSPLAKSFMQDNASLDGHAHCVSARAELFIEGKEYVNCYEEENSPLEQRRKFVEQRDFQRLEQRSLDSPSNDGKAAEENDGIDENYLRALEWGMPPTGGWGCGIDRLVMLFSGRRRIADVLSFGNLGNVVGLGSNGPQKKA